MPERDDIININNTTIVERVSWHMNVATSGNGNKQPFHFGMVFFKMKKQGTGIFLNKV
jgi:hypothetical protein